MAIRLKANIGYQPIVEEVSRKFVPKKQTSRRSEKVGPIVVAEAGWMGAGVRTTYRGGLGECKRNYMIIRVNSRQSALTDDELVARTNFATIAPAVKEILTDLTQIVNVQRMWITAKDDKSKAVNGIKAEGYTMRGWIFAVQMAGLVNAQEEGQSYDVNTFPTSFDA